MEVTGIAIVPPEAAKDNLRGTPELIASCFAKYSRSNLGIKNIFEKIDWNDPEGSIGKIFNFIDYGHASIGGLTGGIPIAVDGVSMFILFKIFEFGQLLDGQESSTRYIQYNESALPDPDLIGIPKQFQERWYNLMRNAFELYHEHYERLSKLSEEHPELLKIDPSLPSKVIDRIRKNYALDRSRYFIPSCCKSSGVFIMTARVWSQVIKSLESLPWNEAKECAKLIRGELAKFAPRLIKHSHPDEASLYHMESDMKGASQYVARLGVKTEIDGNDYCEVKLYGAGDSVISNQFEGINQLFEGKTNRYSTVGRDIKRGMVRCTWTNVTFAELRDMNRHRTGHRFSPFVPVGFYLPPEIPRDEKINAFLEEYSALGKEIADIDDKGIFLYASCMGMQVPFEHSTHLDKFIYQIELRTGMGAHFRYAKHYRDAYDKLMEIVPELGTYIILGEAEPE